MRALDLFCGAGGSSMGMARAGFEVVGVDNRPQPRYPFEFHLADALTYPLRGFDVILASPPCQRYARTQNLHHNEHKYPDLIAATRRRLRAWGVPYVIENVPGAPLVEPLVLCGEMFGLGVVRHRLFESGELLFAPDHRPHRGPATYGRAWRDGDVYMTIAGHWSGVERGREAMGIDWMTRDELSHAIPPAYTEWIGVQLAGQLRSIAS